MMTPCNHPPLAFVRRFAVGTLGAPFDFVVGAHIDQCADCRSASEGFEIVGGALVDTLAPAPLADDAFAKTLGRLEERAPEIRTGPDWLPPSLKAQRMGPEFPVGVGVSMRRVWTGRHGRGRVYLLRARASSDLPRHDHRGLEITCVLKGGYTDESGPHVRGDCWLARAGHVHTPRVDDDGECICLIATEAPPRARGLPGLIMRVLM